MGRESGQNLLNFAVDLDKVSDQFLCVIIYSVIMQSTINTRRQFPLNWFSFLKINCLILNSRWGTSGLSKTCFLCVPVTLEVLYQKRSITESSGSSIKLSCKANYDLEQCGLVHVAWTQKDTELTDPSKYITTVNETVSVTNMTLRQVETEVLDLTTDDAGEFQCKASCEKGDKAMGHFIRLKVEGKVVIKEDKLYDNWVCDWNPFV